MTDDSDSFAAYDTLLGLRQRAAYNARLTVISMEMGNYEAATIWANLAQTWATLYAATVQNSRPVQ